MAKSDPIRDAIQKALKMAGQSAKASAGSATKTLTKAERKAINQAKAAADRAAKTTASRERRVIKRAENKKRYFGDLDDAVATRYGRGDTRLQKAKAEVATEIDRIFRVAEGTDPIVRRTGARRKAIDKAIKKFENYLVREGYNIKLTIGEKASIARDALRSAERANATAGKRLESTVKYYKGKESAPLKELGPKTVKAGSSKKPASKQTKLQREAARSVRQAKKEGRETVVREAARRAIRKEAKGQKLVEISDARKMANQAEVDKALAASRQRKLMAQVKKGEWTKKQTEEWKGLSDAEKKARIAEMKNRAPSKRKKESVKETESSKRLRAAQEKNAKDVVDPRFKKMTPAQQKRSQERLRADAKRLRSVSTSRKGMTSEEAQAELKRLGERGLETYGKAKAKPAKGRKPVTWVRDSSGKLVPKKK